MVKSISLTKVFNLNQARDKEVCGRVAQLDRASACGAEGRRFNSCRDHHNKITITIYH
jgi:hypothetical protein